MAREQGKTNICLGSFARVGPNASTSVSGRPLGERLWRAGRSRASREIIERRQRASLPFQDITAPTQFGEAREGIPGSTGARVKVHLLALFHC